MTQTASGRPVRGEIRATQALSSSKLSDYVVNPYLGCSHGCKYCYVQRYFRSRVTPPAPWGDETYARINIGDLARRETRTKSPGRVLLSSMCDAYQPMESRYRLTRSVLECLIEGRFPISVLTKSSLVLRDIDILAEGEATEVTFSVSSLDPKIHRAFEPRATPPNGRLEALRAVLDSGVKGGLFVAPHIPSADSFDSQYMLLFERVVEFGLKELTFDSLNYSSVMKRAIMRTYESEYPQGKGSFVRLLEDPGAYDRMWRGEVQRLAARFDLKVTFV